VEQTPKITPPQRKLSYKEKTDLDGMEQTILVAEKCASDLEAMLNDPAFHATRALEAPAMIARLAEQRAEIERLYARWEELSNL
jgi:ATP-binding cassette subfamily F protein uup